MNADSNNEKTLYEIDDELISLQKQFINSLKSRIEMYKTLNAKADKVIRSQDDLIATLQKENARLQDLVNNSLPM